MELTPEQQAELDEVLAHRESTRRSVAPGIEELMHERIPVLDRGFIRVVDYLGGDDAVVQSARVSYGRGTKRTSTDRGLIRYLMRHRHTSPFEMARLKLHVRAPIFVMRQWIRHRMSSTNEISARYSILPAETYEPEPGSVAEQSATNRQGRGEPLPGAVAESVRRAMAEHSNEAFALYEDLLNVDADGNLRDPSRPGLARELARAVLPLSTYTEWYWLIDIHNLLGFCALRSDKHAQLEIREYSDVILHRIIANWMPLTYEAFMDYRMEAYTFSAGELAILRDALAGRDDEVASLRKRGGLSNREWSEFTAALRLNMSIAERFAIAEAEVEAARKALNASAPGDAGHDDALRRYYAARAALGSREMLEEAERQRPGTLAYGGALPNLGSPEWYRDLLARSSAALRARHET